MKRGRKPGSTSKAAAAGTTKKQSSGKLTPGQSIRSYRESHGLTQGELGEKAGLSQATISGLETDRITLGLERAKAIAKALKVHPATLAFPGWDAKKDAKA